MRFQTYDSPVSRHAVEPWLRAVIGTVLVLAFLGAASTSAAHATEPTATETQRALGHLGEIYSLHIGTFGQLFPEAGAATPNIQVMALEIESADSPTARRILVPGTDTWRPEKEPRLVVDPTTGAVLIAWQAGTTDGTVTLHFTSFDGEEWGPTDQIRTAGTPHFFQAPPTLLVSNDRLDLEIDETTTVTVGRTLFHVLWIEDETQSVRYSPVPFIEGRYAGWNEVLTLSSALTKSHEGEVPSDGSLPLLLDSTIADGGHALSITLSEPIYGRLGTIRMAIQPPQLDLLADEIIQAILEANPDLSPQHLQNLIEKLAGRMIIIGAKMRLNPAITEYVSQHVGEWLLEHGGNFQGNLAALGQAARGQALDFGSLVYGRMIVDPSNPNEQIPEVDVGDILDSNGHRAKLAALVRIEVTADFEAPELPDGTVVYTSADGAGMLVAWSDETAVHYLENRGDGWSTARSLALSENLDSAQAHTLLRSKIR